MLAGVRARGRLYLRRCSATPVVDQSTSSMDIFLSRPTWIDRTFEAGLGAFMTRLADAGLTPRTLGKSDYPIAAPLDEVLEIMSECRGAIILGYPQIEISVGTLKATPLPSPTTLGTEWNQIEAALAYARKMPLLIVHHIGVGRGVFDRGVLSGFIYSSDLTDPLWSQNEAVSGALATWKMRVAKYVSPGTPEAPVVNAPKGSAACPNCSTSGHPFYMTKLSDSFASRTGNTHLCNRCHGAFNCN